MAIDAKFGRVTLEHGSVGEDEPVVVFRARDSVLPKLLAYYHLFCLRIGSPKRHLDMILSARDQVIVWQEQHGSRIPKSDGSKEWLGK